MQKKKYKNSPSKEKDESKVLRFIGISLAGGKSDKACVAVLEYYPENKKLFLSRLFEKIKSDEQISADLKIHELIEQNANTAQYVAFDVPWNLPNCLTCKKKCPGYENCHEPHIEWMWHHHNEKLKKKRPKKLFTPYTQRCVELYLQSELEEVFNLHHAMGSNSAPLLARAAFIQKRLSAECIEVYPKLTLWRLGSLLNVMKSHLRNHKAAFGGDESRAQFLQSLNDHNIAFVYNQDMKQMVENNHAFEAFLCGFTAYLKYKGLTEKRPKNFPGNEDWIDFPVQNLKLKDLAV
ncbi:MAG: DUF429 domain-containing protein [Pseudobdellovibrio sp.]